ncbi:flavin reductase family protein [Petroclostridium sp. X23]|uniref:flavin reductase family protein n=1 Tax=Petroclostridium sp. X23 TaxID=3045146 RepID=UPI0024AE6E29|nr:flavin reductase family protein [Petroclostridium sp. X23]WHH60479.1 flavin reductase family protein [Petroclostridium sp. X23]
MEKITMVQSIRYSSPHPYGLVISMGNNKKVNIMGVSWWTFASTKPPIILVSLSKACCTNQNIKETRQFSLCLPCESMKEKAWKCSTSSGYKIDKVKEYNIDVISSQSIEPPILKESHIAYECEVVQIIEAGDHDIFMSNIIEIYGDLEKKHLYTDNGYSKLICCATNTFDIKEHYTNG